MCACINQAIIQKNLLFPVRVFVVLLALDASFPRVSEVLMHNLVLHAVNIKLSTESRHETQHDISPLCLGKSFISLLRSNVTKMLKVEYESRLCASIHSDTIMAHEASVSLSSNDGIRIVDVKSKDISKSANREDVEQWDFQVSAALESLGEKELQRMMPQVETDLRCWYAMYSIPREVASEGGIVVPTIEFTLLSNSSNFLSVRGCRNPREAILESVSLHAQPSKHAGEELVHRICSIGISSAAFFDKDGRAWLAGAAIVCHCAATIQDSPVQLVPPSPFVAPFNIIGALQKSSWSKKAGFRFKSRKGSIVSIAKRLQTLSGKHQYAQISSIFLAFIPAGVGSIPDKSDSMAVIKLFRSATNAAIDDLHRQLAAEAGQTQEHGTGSVHLLVDSLVGTAPIGSVLFNRNMTDSHTTIYLADILGRMQNPAIREQACAALNACALSKGQNSAWPRSHNDMAVSQDHTDNTLRKILACTISDYFYERDRSGTFL